MLQMKLFARILRALPTIALLHGSSADLDAAGPLHPRVTIEEDVYTYEPANNGAGPLWCSGSTCLVRVGERLFASGLETLNDLEPLNNCRWMLFERRSDGWRKVFVDETGRTREPSPLAAFSDGRLFLSANPTLVAPPKPGGGPARPELVRFSVAHPETPAEAILPKWAGTPEFSEHSYRSFAADGRNGELILFQNIGYTHAEWAFRDPQGEWSAQGQLQWPWGAEYDKPQPIRVCYPNVALKNRAVYFCGVSDIVEPYEAWRAFKKDLTGREWDYDFRRLFFTWTPDIASGKFADWVEIASRDKTCGWVSPGDLWVDPEGAAHILWTERALDERLRKQFFPNAKQSHSLNYAVVRDGKIVTRRTLLQASEGGPNEVPSAARFQITADHRLFVICYVSGTTNDGRAVSENRVMEILGNGTVGESAGVGLRRPFTSFFTATGRAGSPPANFIELLGQQAGQPSTISYARVELW